MYQNKNEAIKDPAIKEFVIRQTKEKVCACDHFNPSPIPAIEVLVQFWSHFQSVRSHPRMDIRLETG